jgi:hypothetical protein
MLKAKLAEASFWRPDGRNAGRAELLDIRRIRGRSLFGTSESEFFVVKPSFRDKFRFSAEFRLLKVVAISTA